MRTMSCNKKNQKMTGKIFQSSDEKKECGTSRISRNDTRKA